MHRFRLIAMFSGLYQIFMRVHTEPCHGSVQPDYGMALQRHVFQTLRVPSSLHCLTACDNDIRCQSINHVMGKDFCELNNRTKEAAPKDLIPDSTKMYVKRIRKRVPLGSIPEVSADSCQEIKATEGEQAATGKYWLSSERSTYLTYCQMESSGQGWTLISRFSNTDAINWMIDSGEWWHDKNVAVGETIDPSHNTDMISPAFWQVSGKELKITRSDDPQHIALLQTTGDCLGGQTFRSKMTSYGVFRNNQKFSGSNGCSSSCDVQYGGQYNETCGFQQAGCDGEIQSANKIGFWCAFGYSGSVVMIGGGGRSCDRSSHGLGITASKLAAFYADSGRPERDFGDSAHRGSEMAHSLNLWIH